VFPAPQQEFALCRNPHEDRCLDSGINMYNDFLRVHVFLN
jgi:hypothetical protein